MAYVITEAAQILCSHGAKALLVASQHILSVDGVPALVLSDVATATIEGCPNIGPGLVPCTKILPPVTGISITLQVAGQPVLLQSATGQTDSTPPVTWEVVFAGQVKLDAL